MLPNELLLQILDDFDPYNEEILSFSHSCRRIHSLALKRLQDYGTAHKYFEVKLGLGKALDHVLTYAHEPELAAWPRLLQLTPSLPLDRRTGMESRRPQQEELDMIRRVLSRAQGLPKDAVDKLLRKIENGGCEETVFSTLFAILPNLTMIKLHLQNLSHSLQDLTRMFDKIRDVWVGGHDEGKNPIELSRVGRLDIESTSDEKNPIQLIAAMINLPELKTFSCTGVDFKSGFYHRFTEQWHRSCDAAQLFGDKTSYLSEIHFEHCKFYSDTFSALLGSIKALKKVSWIMSGLDSSYFDRICWILGNRCGGTLEELYLRPSYEIYKDRFCLDIHDLRSLKVLELPFWLVQELGIRNLMRYHIPESIERLMFPYDKTSRDERCNDSRKSLYGVSELRYYDLEKFTKLADIRLPQWKWKKKSGKSFITALRQYLRSKHICRCGKCKKDKIG